MSETAEKMSLSRGKSSRNEVRAKLMSCVSRRSRSLRSVVRDWRSFNEAYSSPTEELISILHKHFPEEPTARIHTFLHSRTSEERAAIRLALESHGQDNSPNGNHSSKYFALISGRRFKTEYRDVLNGRFPTGNPRTQAQAGASDTQDILGWIRRGLRFVAEREKFSASEYDGNFEKFPTAAISRRRGRSEPPEAAVSRGRPPSELGSSELGRILEKMVSNRKFVEFRGERQQFADREDLLEEHYVLPRAEDRKSEYFEFTKTSALAISDKKINDERRVKHALRFAQHNADSTPVRVSLAFGSAVPYLHSKC